MDLVVSMHLLLLVYLVSWLLTKQVTLVVLVARFGHVHGHVGILCMVDSGHDERLAFLHDERLAFLCLLIGRVVPLVELAAYWRETAFLLVGSRRFLLHAEHVLLKVKFDVGPVSLCNLIIVRTLRILLLVQMLHLFRSSSSFNLI